MTPLKKIVVRTLERLLSRLQEGPNLPARYVELVEDFQWYGGAQLDWRAFCIGLAQTAWREGYARGYETAERWDSTNISPEEVADFERPGWRNSPAYEPEPR
jgi:hypothetical protein